MTEKSKIATQVTSQKGEDERGTPISLIRKLQTGIGGSFSLDPCSGAEPVQIADNRFTINDDGLKQSWAGYDTVYVNPPYSELKKWLQKIDQEYHNDHPQSPELIIALIPGNTSTQWFQNHATKADYLVAVEGRLKFDGIGQSAPFASLLLVFGEPSTKLRETLDHLGAVYTKEEIESTTQLQLDALTDNDTPTDQTPTIETTDLGEISMYDRIEVNLDHSRPGYPSTIPHKLTGTVVNGRPATESDDTETTHWQSLLLVDDETETYIQIYQDPHHTEDIYASVEVPGKGWRDVHILSLRFLNNLEGITAIEPYGPETAYVC